MTKTLRSQPSTENKLLKFPPRTSISKSHSAIAPNKYDAAKKPILKNNVFVRSTPS